MEVLKVDHVTKRFGSYAATNDVSFSLDSGRILGLLGPNGAGKTTMIRMLTNIFVPDEGTIAAFGEKIGYAMQNRIGYLPEERGLYKKLKVIEQLIYFGRLKGLSRADAQKRATFWLNQLDAADWAPKKIQELSKGMQQKIQFISTILHNPSLMILDEPFSGFDPINTELLKKIIIDMRNDGKTIILSTHVMEQAEQLCDDICLINKGKIVLSGSLRDIKKARGRDSIILEFEGDDSFLDQYSDLQFINRTANRVEFRFRNDFSPNEFIKSVSSTCQITKYELSEPALHEIFIDAVSRERSIENE